MHAIILAAGKGSRLGNLTKDKPKARLRIRDEELFSRVLRMFEFLGIKDVAVVTGYLSNQFNSYKCKKFHNEDWINTNMIGSLLEASNWLENNECIISYSDIFFQISILNRLILSEADISIAYDVNWLNLWRNRFVDPLTDAESFRLDEHSNVVNIGEPVSNQDSVEGQYMGLLKFKPSGWRIFKDYLFTKYSRDEIRNIQMTHAINSFIKSGMGSVVAIPNFEIWGEVDSEHDLALYNSDKFNYLFFEEK